MDFSKYIFRAHMVGNIISVPKPLTPTQTETLFAYNERKNGKGKPLTPKQEIDFTSLQHKLNESNNYSLSEGAKKILSNIVFYEKHGRIKTLENQYLEKGLLKEKEARDLLSDVWDVFLTEDKERKFNDWVTGKRDVFSDSFIPDIKCKWNYESFSNSLVDSANEIYLRQGDSYMDLWGIHDFILCHVLVDTPFHLIDKAIYKANFQYGYLSLEGDVYDWAIADIKAIVCDHIFTRKGLEDYCHNSATIHIEWFDDFVEIPKKERVHMIHHPYDKVRIEQRNECIKLARNYMNTVQPINNIVEINY